MTLFDCRLCQAVREEVESTTYVTELSTNSPLRLLDDASQLAPGHALITSRAHLSSTAAAAGTELLLNVEAIVDRVSEQHADRGTRVIFFEHASRWGDGSTQCIEHLHVHALPTQQRVTATTLADGMRRLGAGDLQWRRAQSLAHIAELGTYTPYYWLRDTDGLWWVSLVTTLQPSQLWRRWCVATGLGAGWNWRQAHWGGPLDAST